MKIGLLVMAVFVAAVSCQAEMSKKAKIYVAGHNGLVGSAIVRQLTAEGYTNIITRSHTEVDLRNQQEVYRFLIEKNLIMFFCVPQRSAAFLQIKQSLQNLFMII